MADEPIPGESGLIFRWPKPGVHASRQQFIAYGNISIGARPGDMGMLFRWTRPGLHASLQQSFAADRLTFVAPARLQWKPQFPDIVWRARPRQSQSSVWTPIVNLPPVPAQWGPEYPSIIPKPAWRRPGGSAPDVFRSTFIAFGWKTVFPDSIDRLRIHPAALTQSVLGLHSTNPVHMEWKSIFPDLHWRSGQPTHLQQPQAQNVEPLPNPPSPELAWGPRYSDWIPSAPRSAWFQPFTGDPRVMPPSPELAWKAIAPDQIDRRLLSVAAMPSETFQQIVLQPDLRMDWQATIPDPVRRARAVEGFSVRPAEVPVSPVVWLVDRQDPPDVIQRGQFLIHGGATAPLFITVIGESIAWQSLGPSLLARPARLTADGSVVVQPVLPVPNSWCVMFSDDAIIAPALAPELFGAPALAEEMVRTPMLTNEQVC